MRILADENLPYPVIVALRLAGHDVEWVFEDARGKTDIDILAYARTANRYLLTFDLDFGALIFRDRAPSPPCVILLRFEPDIAWDELAPLLVALLGAAAGWTGMFVVIDDRRVRLTPLPRLDGGNGASQAR